MSGQLVGKGYDLRIFLIMIEIHTSTDTKVDTTQEQLIAGCKVGNRDARKALYKLFAPKMFAVAKRFMVDKKDAEDVLHDAFISILLNFHQYDAQKAGLQGWIYKIVVHEAIRHIKKKHRMELIEFNDEIEDELSFVPIADQLTLNELKSLIGKLPIRQRTVFNLAAIDGYSHIEIAELLAITPSTSRSQFYRAREFLISEYSKRNKESAYT